MILLGIIGLGTIFKKQWEALQYLKNTYKVVCVFDNMKVKRNETMDLFQKYDCAEEISICNSLDKFLEQQIDVVLISVPVEYHFQLAEVCLKAGKKVILEKPAVLSLKELEELYKIADEYHTYLYVAYHAAFSTELNWYFQWEEKLKIQYDLGKLKKIQCYFFDPYMKEGYIEKRKEMLGGSYIDSGINILSVCEKILNLSDFSTKLHREKKMNYCTYSSSTVYTDGTIEISMETGWDKGINQKVTWLEYENEKKVFLDHSNQSVAILEKTEKSILYQDNKIPRLIQQYMGVFSDFALGLKNKRDNRETSLVIHNLLLMNYG